jgi:aminopeptidase N
LRIATAHTPSAYQAVIYEKGAYVLHMLRMLMWDHAAKTPDAAFIDMMHDYAKTFAGKLASTADFQHVVEHHMLPTMNATGDGKMDWFFNQWVNGTDVPRLTADLHLAASGDEVHITGKVAQSQVPPTSARWCRSTWSSTRGSSCASAPCR